MCIKDLLRPSERTALRRFRKRLANRDYMRGVRAADPSYGRHLCAGVDLPLEAGTCGRLVDKRFERCIRCHNRRGWLLNHFVTPYEAAIAGQLASEIEHDAAEAEHNDAAHAGAIVPLLDAVDNMFASADLYRSR